MENPTQELSGPDDAVGLATYSMQHEGSKTSGAAIQAHVVSLTITSEEPLGQKTVRRPLPAAPIWSSF